MRENRLHFAGDEERAGNAIIFSGPEGTEEYHTTVNVQTLFSREVGGNYDDLESLYLDLKAQFENAGGTTADYKQQTLEHNGATYPVITFEASYQLNGENIWQWLLLLDRDSDVFYQISYTAPVELADLSEQVFYDMLESFTLVDF